MGPIFSVGIHALWNELRHMPTGGVWWVNTERYEDAARLANSTISAQKNDAKVALVTMGTAPKKILTSLSEEGPDEILLYKAQNTKNSLYSLLPDMSCNIKPKHYLIIFLLQDNFFRNISSETLHKIANQINLQCQKYQCTLLVINPGNRSDDQYSALINAHRSLNGLASLRPQNDAWCFDVAFWCNEKGVSARQQLTIRWQQSRWELCQSVQSAPQPRSDERTILSHQAVLEGAPPLSEHWRLFDSNQALFEAARGAQAATIIFSLTNNRDVETIAHDLHALRRQRGSALKLVVRESQASLRAVDERLLMGSGASLVIPGSTPLSRSLTLIESVQGQQYSRPVPESLAELVGALRPLQLRGWQPWGEFCTAIEALLHNPLIPEDNRGVLVALRPVPGLATRQALSLCRLKRQGDIMAANDQRIVLFLSYCQVNSLDIALKNIFSLPPEEVVSNRVVWFEDRQIAAELVQMRTQAPRHDIMPAAIAHPIARAEEMQSARQHQPQPVTLMAPESAYDDHQ
ncbi:cellulose biosynthesis protein BcsE [Enterobacteriaceae bacterium BIT-l23]|uniref:cellulose biosynthesis protein BcsE n=1 Tax=Jejubacter sp. L23 TaxID=3092086 RepID=UPI0015856233|nr:cellulose biosynthesis protein BcsE [Enterobacteriaceae bacterium BIT-l23]